MNEPKKPGQRAKATVEKGVDELFRAANSVASAVRRETKKPGGLGKAIDDAGREVVRAASQVANRLGGGLQNLGKKAQDMVNEDGHEASASGGKGSDEEWPKTREEYEKKYGRDGDDWPKTREAYEEKYGRPPRKRGDDDDPGFRIA